VGGFAAVAVDELGRCPQYKYLSLSGKIRDLWLHYPCRTSGGGRDHELKAVQESWNVHGKGRQIAPLIAIDAISRDLIAAPSYRKMFLIQVIIVTVARERRGFNEAASTLVRPQQWVATLPFRCRDLPVGRAAMSDDDLESELPT
jgi:hypothetical protein